MKTTFQKIRPVLKINKNLTLDVFLDEEQFLLTAFYDQSSSWVNFDIKTSKNVNLDTKESEFGGMPFIKKVPASNFESNHNVLYSSVGSALGR